MYTIYTLYRCTSENMELINELLPSSYRKLAMYCSVFSVKLLVSLMVGR